MTEVMCTVNNCTWWAEGNRCEASRILVTSNDISDSYPEDVDVDQISMIVSEQGTTPTETSMETCCKTFHSESKKR